MEIIFCAAADCTNPARQGSLCPKHYSREKYGATPLEPDTSPMPDCDVPHCDRTANARTPGAFCQAHYHVKYLGGDPYTRIIRSDRGTRAKCWVGDCPRRAVTHSLCNTHARQAREDRIKVPAELGVKHNPACSFEGCERVSSARTLCHGHYSQWREGRVLGELREYGKYTKGELVCAMTNCRKPAISKSLCTNHATLRSTYGLTTEEFLAAWSNPICETPGCGQTKRLHMDHDHATGKFRGLLCGPCNTALGFLKENPERIRGLATYIERFQ